MKLVDWFVFLLIFFVPSSDHTTEEETDILDPSVARQTAKSLQGFLLEKPTSRSSLYSSLRCSAAELMGRGFHLWENYVDVPAVVMGLLDLAITPGLPSSSSAAGDERAVKKHRAIKFVAEIAKRALNLMVLLRPITVVTALAKEVSLYLVSSSSGSAPHSSLPQMQASKITFPQHHHLKPTKFYKCNFYNLLDRLILGLTIPNICYVELSSLN